MSEEEEVSTSFLAFVDSKLLSSQEKLSVIQEVGELTLSERAYLLVFQQYQKDILIH